MSTTTTPPTSLHDTRPTDFEYALMSNHVYDLPKVNDVLVYKEKTYPWVVVSVVNKTGWFKSGYFSALYYNKQTNHYVLAHRGTNWKEMGNLWEDYRGIFSSQNSAHKEQCFNFIQQVIKDYIKNDVKLEADKPAPRLSFTGHSLGAFLAEMSVYICSMDKYDFTLPHVNAVTFDSPGTKKSMEAWKSSVVNHVVDVTLLDIVSYVSYPNIVNTFDNHVGTLFHVKPKLSKDDSSLFSKLNPIKFTLEAHLMEGLLETFDSKAVPPSRVFVLGWPCGFKQKQTFFENYIKTDNEDGTSFYSPKEEAFDSFKEMIKSGYLVTKKFTPQMLHKIQFEPTLFEKLERISKWLSNGNNNEIIDTCIREEEMDNGSSSMKEVMKNFLVLPGRQRKDSVLILSGDVSAHDFRAWVSRDFIVRDLEEEMKKRESENGPKIKATLFSGNVKAKNIENCHAIGVQVPDSYDKDYVERLAGKLNIDVALASGNCEIDFMKNCDTISFEIKATNDPLGRAQVYMNTAKKIQSFLESKHDTKMDIDFESVKEIDGSFVFSVSFESDIDTDPFDEYLKNEFNSKFKYIIKGRTVEGINLVVNKQDQIN